MFCITLERDIKTSLIKNKLTITTVLSFKSSKSP